MDNCFLVCLTYVDLLCNITAVYRYHSTTDVPLF